LLNAGNAGSVPAQWCNFYFSNSLIIHGNNRGRVNRIILAKMLLAIFARQFFPVGVVDIYLLHYIGIASINIGYIITQYVEAP